MSFKANVRWTLTVQDADGTWKALGPFRQSSGGDLDSGDTKSVAAAGEIERARGGRQTVSNVVLTREDDGSVDLKWLATRRGKASIIASRTPLDDDGNAMTARAITHTGKLKRVTPGDADAQSETDLDDFEVELSLDGIVS